jgi:hypothetical protein
VRFEQRAHDAESEEQRAAAIIANKIQGRNGSASGCSDSVKSTGERNEIDVVPRGRRERSILPPSRHAAVNQARIARVTHFGPEPESFHHARAVAFEQNVRACCQLACDSVVRILLESERDNASPAQRDIDSRIGPRAGPSDMDHVGAHVREQHCAKGYWPEGGKLQDLDTGQRSCRPLLCSFVR